MYCLVFSIFQVDEYPGIVISNLEIIIWVNNSIYAIADFFWWYAKVYLYFLNVKRDSAV